MTHVVIEKENATTKSRVNTSDLLEAVTVLETPPMIIHGIVGYKKTIHGLMRTKVILAEKLAEGVIRRMFTKKFVPNMTHSDLRKTIGYSQEDIEELKKNSDFIRVLANSQVQKIKTIGQKKSHIAEIQINGGSITNKVEFALQKLEQGEVKLEEVFAVNEFIDTIGVTKGKGFQGVVKRWGVRQLARKTNKGTRKVACIGAWHPSRVMYSVARAGQMGFHRRTQMNSLIYAMGNGKKPVNTEYDLTVKTINPLGGFPNYGLVNDDFIMLKGPVTGPSKRVVTLRKALVKHAKIRNHCVKFIDTSSKIGGGRFQTAEEKTAFYGSLRSVRKLARKNAN